MVEVSTPPCLGCGTHATFTMTKEQFDQYQAGEHVQRIFPDWSEDDREMLISGTCPTCWEDIFPEEDEEEWYPEDEEFFGWATPSLLDPESGDLTYEKDWYVD